MYNIYKSFPRGYKDNGCCSAPQKNVKNRFGEHFGETFFLQKSRVIFEIQIGNIC